MRAFSFFRAKKEPTPTPITDADNLATALDERAEAAARRGYLPYLVALFRRTSPYAIWQRARTAFAPAIFLSRLFRILRIALRVLEASALFLFAAALLLFVTPFALLFALVAVAHATLSARRTDRHLLPDIAERRVLILFSTTASDTTARALAALSAQYTVLAVVPLFGGAGRRLPLFAAARREGGIILVREYYYFHLARRLLHRAAFCARIY